MNNPAPISDKVSSPKDYAFREAQLRAKAADVFRASFIETWLRTPIPLYGNRTPLEMAYSEAPEDCQRVLDDLIGLEEGVLT